MAIFNEALEEVLKNEGLFNDIKEDRGGATKYGISLAFYKNTIDPDANSQTIKELHKDDAESIYFDHFWLKHNYNEIASQLVATKLFDIAVNLGSTVANKFLQQAYNALNLTQLTIDGILGKATINNLNKCNNEQNILIVEYLRILQKHYYLEIVKHRVDQSKFLKGWLKRASR